MKTKIIILIHFLLLTLGSSYAQNWSRLSKEIKKSQKKEALKLTDYDNFYIDMYYKYRKETGVFNKLKINLNNDTIFILEMHGDLSNSHYLSSAWNKLGLISYDYDKDSLKYENTPMFGVYMLKLISEWDVEKIRVEEKVNSNMVPNTIIYATRIIFENKKCTIDCIRFKDFFNLERDRMDFRK